jgi:Na+/H+ antiporter NhaA
MATLAASDQTRGRLLLAQLAGPLRRYIATEAGGAGLALGAALVALVWANSPASDAYVSLWDTELALRLGDEELAMTLREWVNDGLMALFFFVVGLEVRRELTMGELRGRERIVVPLAAAAGGMIVPALLYLAIAPADAHHGWGIVIGTDTAFLLGALAIVGPSCPTQLRVFLLSLTVFDDVVAIAIIGVVYTDGLDPVALAVAGACLAGIACIARLGAWRTALYAGLIVALWLATLESGLHATIAGMTAGLLVASRPPGREEVEHASRLFAAFRQSPLPETGRSAARGIQRAVSVNERLQALLHPWASYVIVPLFALANAGVDLRGGLLGEALRSPLTWAIVVGLVAGKLAGIGAGALGSVRLGAGSLPRGVGEGQVLGGAALSGIGFTVSLLIVHLAFDEARRGDEATVGVLLAAPMAALLGWVVFRLAAVLRGERTAGLPRVLDPPVDPARDHVRGPADAPLELVEYADFACPFCARATGVLDDLRRRFGDELRYVFRHLPLADVHPRAEAAAIAAEAAGAQGRFWEMHDLLFARQDELEDADFVAHAAELGLDVERFLADLADERLARRVQEDVESAEASGAHATPTFFVGGLRHLGPWDAETLAAALEASRGRAAATDPVS